MEFLAGPNTAGTTPVIPGLRDLRLIGSGSFAAVYRAIEDITFREVAVKVLRPEIAPELVERAFLNEAAVLGQISSHPNIIDLFRADRTAHAQPFLVLRYVGGGDLRELVQSTGPLPWERALRILRPVLDALRFAHDHNVLHCDLKPANVLLTEAEQPVLVDFGVSRFVGATRQPATSLGAWSYTAPECLAGQAPTPQSDLYSLGAVTHLMLTGRPPVDLGRSSGAHDAMTTRIGAVVDPLPSAVPSACADVLRSMIAVAPEHRPVSANAVLQQLASGSNGSTATTQLATTQSAQPAPIAPVNQWWREI